MFIKDKCYNHQSRVRTYVRFYAVLMIACVDFNVKGRCCRHRPPDICGVMRVSRIRKDEWFISTMRYQHFQRHTFDQSLHLNS